jgi:hypothetical protein
MTMSILLLASLATTVPLLAMWLGDERHQRVRT